MTVSDESINAGVTIVSDQMVVFATDIPIPDNDREA